MFRCPKCKAELPADARFCNKCGYKPDASTMSAPPQQGAGQQPMRPGANPQSSPSQGARGPIQQNPLSPPNLFQGSKPPTTPTPAPQQAGRPGNVPSQGQPGAQQPMGMQQGRPGGPPQPQDQIVRTSTPPPPRMPKAPQGQPGGAQNPQGQAPARTQQGQMPGGQQNPQNWNMFAARARSFLSAESLVATTQAAEKWRNSWRDRQRAEAGPAVGVARGQAVVPEPLMAMQYSLARMRATIIPNSSVKAGGRDMSLWATFGMIGLIVLVCIYLVTTFIPTSDTATNIQNASAMNALTPGLITKATKKGPTPSAALAGHTLPIHGDNFGVSSPISFLFDSKPLATSAQSNSKGTFDATITIPAAQLAGSYTLEAKNKNTGKSADLTVQVLPANATTNNTPLTVTDAAGAPITGLTFKSVNGQDPGSGQTPVAQSIVLKNTGATDVQWTVSTPTENGQNWLSVNGGTTNGTIGAAGTTVGANLQTLNISVSSLGLPPSIKPYKGYVVVTVDQNQLVIPVSFTVTYTTMELVISPNPLVVIPAGGGACVPTALTIVNISNQAIVWNANPDNGNVQLDSKAGQLDPAGGAADTKTINITCGGISQNVDNFATINVYFNKQHIAVPVDVRPS